MPNKNYIKGRRKEYKIVNAAKADGKLAFRSAGSHSPFDVVIIDREKKEITLVQSKPDDYSVNECLKLYAEYKDMNNVYWTVRFKVI